MRFVLNHRHDAAQCGVAFAAWRGYDSRLRHSHALATCASETGDGQHLLTWTVEAPSLADALALLPPWLAERTEAQPVDEVAIP
jgi:hypothetical protein